MEVGRCDRTIPKPPARWDENVFAADYHGKLVESEEPNPTEQRAKGENIWRATKSRLDSASRATPTSERLLFAILSRGRETRHPVTILAPLQFVLALPSSSLTTVHPLTELISNPKETSTGNCDMYIPTQDARGQFVFIFGMVIRPRA